MKKILAVVLGMCLTVAVLSAGGTKDGSKSDDKPITIRLSSRWGGEDALAVYFRQKIEEFNAQNNGIVIVGDHVTEEKAYFDKLGSQFAAGTQPEIFIEYGGTRLKDYVESGVLLDLTPYLDADPQWKNSFLPLFEKWTFSNPKGVYGVPVMLYAIVLYANADLLKQHGLSVPTTFSELENVCAALVKKGVSPFLLGEKNNFRAGHLLNNLVLKSYGPDAVSALANRSLKYNGPEMLSLYAKIKEFNDKGYFGKNAIGVDNNGEKAAFLSGQTAFRYDGAWFVSDVSASPVGKGVKIVAFPGINPKYDGAFQGGAGQGFSIAKKDAKTNEAAVKVVKFLTSQEYYAGLEKACSGGIYPVKFTSLKDTVVNDLTIQVKSVIANATAYKDDIQNYDSETHMLNTVRTALQGLFIGDTPEQVGTNITQRMKNK
ncbi:extracellular solute-binding protein [Treponema sp. HNW]|uniref:ABC transporter substrate-binding protein n=1 Tax=Treponema sp. HNW TaxID=3116654 RepID=UPI003D0D28E4